MHANVLIIVVGTQSIVTMKTYTSNYMMKGNILSSTDTLLHIIDHGSVVYLNFLQMHFYDQKDSLLCYMINKIHCCYCRI